MAIFKIEIPDDKKDFIIELFKQLSFLKYHTLNPENKKLEKKRENEILLQQKQQQAKLNKLNQLNGLRNTINSIQSARSDSHDSILFRFQHGTEVSALKINTYNHLLTSLERYFRTSVKKFRFEENTNNDTYPMDKYLVYVTLEDDTELKAGFCNNRLN
ncbi:hypothetical protein [Carboxylicivirga marina]|uniref:Uncharacterized protein n=1 Tax=Carboxylicivirga marina TaxID=2800988 RepID=A0ABS1HM28_9BACT|nr:hypothetical protein [Carboxylicivirga marina]MBK3518602.1 hypothetical protein [Carboxylicivirga marina]